MAAGTSSLVQQIVSELEYIHLDRTYTYEGELLKTVTAGPDDHGRLWRKTYTNANGFRIAETAWQMIGGVNDIPPAPPAPSPGPAPTPPAEGGWTPAQLFASGQLGAWYDPRDLSTMFQDRAGTVPVTGAGQKVGRILDKSGRANHWTAQDNADSLDTDTRATLTTDGAGKWWLEFDGTPDGYLTGAMGLDAGPWSWALAIRRHAPRPLTFINEKFSTHNYAGYVDSDDGLASDLDVIPTFGIDGFTVPGNSRAALATAFTTATNHVVTVTDLNLTGWTSFGFGGQWYSSPFQGRFYGGVLRKSLTADELNALRIWLGTLGSSSTVAAAPTPMPQDPAGTDWGPEPANPTEPEDQTEPVPEPDPTPFTPAKLFGPGIAGMWYDFNDLSTMWQDAAKTVPVTAAGQPVGYISDKSGNGLHWVRSGDDSTRPTLMTDSGGKNYLNFSGAQGLITVNKVVPAVEVDLFVALRRDVVTAGDTIWFHALSTGGSNLGITSQNPYHPFNGTAMKQISIDAVDWPFDVLQQNQLDDATAPATGTGHVVEFRKALIGAWNEFGFGGFPAARYTGRLYSVVCVKALTVQDRRKLQEWLQVQMDPPVEMFPPATSGTVCIREEASGDASGTDWANAAAYDPVMTFKRGFTYYVADGVYNFAGVGMNYNTPTLDQAAIVIKKATAADHGPDTGWNTATMGSGQAVLKGTQQFATGYWILDGNIDRPLWATDGYGIKVQVTTGANIRFGDFNGNFAHNCQILRCELEGNYGDGAGPFPNQDAVAWYNASHRCLISKCYIHDMGRCLFFSGSPSTGTIIEYCHLGKFESNDGEHAETASVWPHAAANWTFRYNLVTHSEGTGGIMMDGIGWDLYGNVFIRLAGGTMEGGNGIIGSWSGTEILQNCRIFHNTFVNIASDLLSGSWIPLTESDASGNKFKNNLMVDCTWGPDLTWFPRKGHNHYINTPTGLGDPNSSTSVGDPFNNRPALDFRPKADSGVAAGLDLLSDRYKYDANGTLRTTWTRGAFEKMAA